jgi:hypothetical protein
MEIDDTEVSSSVVHLIAGATAGTIEHCGMYPVDTIKVCPIVLVRFYINFNEFIVL